MPAPLYCTQNLTDTQTLRTNTRTLIRTDIHNANIDHAMHSVTIQPNATQFKMLKQNRSMNVGAHTRRRPEFDFIQSPRVVGRASNIQWLVAFARESPEWETELKLEATTITLIFD